MVRKKLTAQAEPKRPSPNHEIHKLSVRVILKKQDAPYWALPLGINQSLGFRKLGDVGEDKGTWIARRKDTSGRSKSRHTTKSLGYVSDAFSFAKARDEAFKWFADQERGIADGKTVEDACRAYVEDRATEKSAANAADAQGRFERNVYGNDRHAANPIAAIKLDKLRTADVKAWRGAFITPAEPDGKVGSKASADRNLSALKGALNLAVENGLVSAAASIEWSRVKAFGGGKRRALYLDLQQRRALLKAAKGALRDLIEATMLTGARAGELVNATCKQFDVRSGTLHVTGKTGPRDIPLSVAATKLFARLAEGREPDERLLVRIRDADDVRNRKRWKKGDTQPWAHSDWDELVRDAAAEAKLPLGVCLYTLRHSYITTALQSGMSVSDVGLVVGTSAAMIQKHYHHLVDSHVRARLAKVVMA
jgi:integrase